MIIEEAPPPRIVCVDYFNQMLCAYKIMYTIYILHLPPIGKTMENNVGGGPLHNVLHIPDCCYKTVHDIHLGIQSFSCKFKHLSEHNYNGLHLIKKKFYHPHHFILGNVHSHEHMSA